MSGIDKLFSGMRASSSGLQAERARMNVIAKNLANASTTKTPEGGPYKRQLVLFEPMLEQAEGAGREVVGVRVSKVVSDHVRPGERVFNPSHPDRDADGYVTMPNVDSTQEMVDLISAARSYEANLAAQESFVSIAERALRLAQ